MAVEVLGWCDRNELSSGASSTDAGALDRRQGRTRLTVDMLSAYGPAQHHPPLPLALPKPAGVESAPLP